MNYPLISEYVESIKYAEDNLGELEGLRPVMDANGNPCMSSGNFAVVFKMREEGSGKLYALKCFLREQEGRAESYAKIASELEYVSSGFLTSVRYLEKELFVDTRQTDEREFPVLLMDWVEGVSLDRHVRANIGNVYRLQLLAYQFGRLASWLGAQEFAHGDLKPDNILVREDGLLVLVDYDGMFVPAMRGERARELGSVDFRHPSRSRQVFDGTIDDFALASIALSLKAIALKPELLAKYGAADRLLFSATDYCKPGTSSVLREVVSLADDAEMSRLLGMFYTALAEGNLAQVSFRLFNLSRPEQPAVPELQDVLSTEVTDGDLAEAVEDEYRVKYSRDGLRLLKVPYGLEKYCVKDGTRVICDRAFYDSWNLMNLELPSSLTNIGNLAFGGAGIREIHNASPCFIVEDGVLFDREKKTLIYCFDKDKIRYVVPSAVTSIGDGAFVGSDIREIHNASPCFIEEDGVLFDREKKTLIYCFDKGKIRYVVPSAVTSIGNWAFSDCSSLGSLELPSSLTSIGDCAFSGCWSLRSVTLPSSLTSIGNSAFVGSGIREIHNASPCFIEEDGVLFDREKKTLIYCFDKGKIRYVVPPAVTSIGDSAFSGCWSLRSVTLPSSLTSIEDSAFCACTSLISFELPSFLTSIGDGAFKGCRSLSSLELPSSLTSIGRYAFSGCSSLKFIKVPHGMVEKFKNLLAKTGFRGEVQEV